MIQLPTYEQQFNKITEAYIKGEIKPFNPNFCFCGTVNNNNKRWVENIAGAGLNYSPKEFHLMETALYSELSEIGLVMCGIHNFPCNSIDNWKNLDQHPEYETALFKGMVSALEVLKQIHIERGEVIDDAPVFKKRVLVTG